MIRAVAKIVNLGSVAIALFLVGCGTYAQTTSGADWLRAIPTSVQPISDTDQRVREAADVEPILRFPARIGVARVGRENGRLALVPPPAEEGKAWVDLAKDLGPEYGELVPISPLIAAMVASPPSSYERSDAIRGIIDMVRITAARQHLDAVVIYEADATADSKNNPLSIADWTLIGAFVLPSQDVKAQGVAQAILIDVRNSYPYGTVQAEADDKTVAARFSNHEAERDLSKRVETLAVENLTHQVKDLMQQLKVKLGALDVVAER